jgi:hypothetical protein
MQARIIIPVYHCAPDGHTTFSFKEGEIVSGRAAEMALADHAGEAIGLPDLETKIEPPSETKAPRKRK